MGRQGSRHSGTGRIIRRGPSPIKKISEDNIEAVVESIKNLTRIKNNNDLFPQLGKHYFDDWFESLSNGRSNHPQLQPFARQLFALAVRHEPVSKVYYSGAVVELGDYSWAAVCAVLRELLMP
ncbi:hypothetical protein BG003_008123 [Podila horticola]|nr:hypothetical protein BG003_008123 [Podila horticola]